MFEHSLDFKSYSVLILAFISSVYCLHFNQLAGTKSEPNFSSDEQATIKQECWLLLVD